jgi:serine/threonine protein kinase
MGDFPPQWVHVRDLGEGGQGHVFVVRSAGTLDVRQYVLKRLRNPKREEAFLNEVEAYRSLDHAHILRLIEAGKTPKGKPYILTEYCADGSLEFYPTFTALLPGLRLFRKVADAIAHAHRQARPIYHLDIKPSNILVRNEEPVVADFGICFIDDGEVTLTKEGHRGSLHYCAPELRNPKLSGPINLAAADIYSLGKLLYWLFTKEVYNGHEDDYANEENLLSRRFRSEPHFILLDELVTEMVKKNPASRLGTADTLLTRVDRLISRVASGGRVLDLRVPQRCLYCAEGKYQPAHQKVSVGMVYSKYPVFPDRELRKNPPPRTNVSTDNIYEKLRHVAQAIFNSPNTFGEPAPLLLVCDFCGNVQYFRLDYTDDGKGLNWLP